MNYLTLKLVMQQYLFSSQNYNPNTMTPSGFTTSNTVSHYLPSESQGEEKSGGYVCQLFRAIKAILPKVIIVSQTRMIITRTIKACVIRVTTIMGA